MTGIGRVFLLGAGPGDPGLITRRAAACLGQVDLVLYDALVHPQLLELCRPDAKREFVGKRAGRVAARQEAINARLGEAAEAGLQVARLKGGDPYLFGRGSEEAEYLAARGIPFEVVPGVPSPLAGTSYAGISLSHRALASSIAYITATESPEKDQSAHDWAKLATATQTLVIFMGMRKLDALMDTLVAHGRPATCPAAVIQSASLPSQKTVVGTVGDIAERARAAGVGMPALTVVGEVVSLREQLRWYDNKPLFGKRVLVTRAREQASDMTDALRYAGAEAVEIPSIRIEAPADGGSLLERAVADVADYDWVVFTSVNGVRRFFAELARQGGDSRRLGPVRIAAIGPSTADAIRPHGLEPDAVPDEFRGEAVAEAILSHHDGHMHGLSVLLPRAEVARNALPDALRKAGARVDVVPAYRTLAASDDGAEALQRAFAAGEVDVATFTSPSTVHNTLAALGEGAVEKLSGVTVAAIGPITERAARDAGLRVDITADEYTVPGLIAALEAYYGGRS